MTRKREVLYWGVIGVLVIACLGLAYRGHRLYANEQNLLQKYTNTVIPRIVCIGDSLTQGAGGDGISFPSHLQEILWDNDLYIPVDNLGVGGENSKTIACRVGAEEFKVEAFTIPVDTTPVEMRFQAEEGKVISPLRQGDSNILSDCEIAGIKGRIDIVQESYMAAEYSYTFTRTESGVEVKVEDGTSVIVNSDRVNEDGIFVVYVGTNDGMDVDIDVLIETIKKITAVQEKNAGKYIILGRTLGTGKEHEQEEQIMQEVFGDKYINLREYLSTQAPYETRCALSEADKEQMEVGKVPGCLRSDDIHYNRIAYELIAEKIYERMQKLGYFDEVKGYNS